MGIIYYFSWDVDSFINHLLDIKSEKLIDYCVVSLRNVIQNETKRTIHDRIVLIILFIQDVNDLLFNHLELRYIPNIELTMIYF